MNTITQQRLKLALTLSLVTTLISACSGTPSMDNTSAKPATSTSSADLTSMKWQLASVAQQGQAASARLNSGLAASRYHFMFKGGRLNITGGCNNLATSYQLAANNRITFGQMISTKKACQQPLMDADSEIISYLGDTTSYSLNGSTLTLNTASQQNLRLNGSQTAEKQYGPGTQKFIEINKTNQGLKWREVKYNSGWARINNDAAWKTAYPGIRGFSPENNRAYIVRIFEHTDPQTQQAIWIMDRVTMNGILK